MKVLFIDEVHPLVGEEFTKIGWLCDFHYKTPIEELIPKLSEFNGIIIRSRFPLNEVFLKHATNLKFIGRPGAGLENIDLEYCKQRSIEVFRSPEGNRDAVAEHAVGMLLSLFNNLNRADAEVRNGIWLREENRGHEIKGKTIGIIGYGYMGKAFAQRLKGFDCSVIAYDKYLFNFSDENASEVSLQELQEKCDVISLHTPESAETINLIDAKFLSNCKKNVFLINTARGKSLHTNDVLNAIESGKVLGACLDVLEFESTSFEQFSAENQTLKRLVACPKVILSPHIAGWTHESQFKMANVLVHKIIEAFYPKK
jgi:D-3-phosphoglycerate dehydrogenase / 2-oxoglutarate reductase